MFFLSFQAKNLIGIVPQFFARVCQSSKVTKSPNCPKNAAKWHPCFDHVKCSLICGTFASNLPGKLKDNFNARNKCVFLCGYITNASPGIIWSVRPKSLLATPREAYPRPRNGYRKPSWNLVLTLVDNNLFQNICIIVIKLCAKFEQDTLNSFRAGSVQSIVCH